MSIARLSITDCVTPISLSPIASCRTKCRASSIVPPDISQRACRVWRLMMRH